MNAETEGNSTSRIHFRISIGSLGKGRVTSALVMITQAADLKGMPFLAPIGTENAHGFANCFGQIPVAMLTSSS